MEFELINPSARVRRKRHKPWVFVEADRWAAAQIRVFGDKLVLQAAMDELAAIWARYNEHAGAVRVVEGVALIEHVPDDGSPCVLAAYYGPGDPRNTAVVANDVWPGEQREVVRAPWGGYEVDLPAAARGLEP